MRFRMAMWSIFGSAFNTATVFFLSLPAAAWAQDNIDIPVTQNVVQAAKGLLSSGAVNTQMLGMGNFSVGNLIGQVIFSGIGFIAFVYGKKQTLFAPMVIGILLMGYGWVFTSTLLVYLVGIALTAALYFFRE